MKTHNTLYSCLIVIALFLISHNATANMTQANALYDSEDYENSFKLYQQYAKENNPEAQAKLGIMYFWGRGTRRSEPLAYSWSLKAAKQGNPQAQHTIAYMYENGIYINKDIRKAIDWYTRSAKQNYAPAQANLSSIYIYGNQIPKEIQRGFKLAQAAAEKDNNHAQYLMGHVYQHENKDYRLAIKSYEASAKNGNAAAANQLGVLYFNGEGVNKDLQTAYFWFRIAEENNSPEGLKNRAITENLVEMENLKLKEEAIKKWFADIKKEKEKKAKEKSTDIKKLMEQITQEIKNNS